MVKKQQSGGERTEEKKDELSEEAEGWGVGGKEGRKKERQEGGGVKGREKKEEGKRGRGRKEAEAVKRILRKWR